MSKLQQSKEIIGNAKILVKLILTRALKPCLKKYDKSHNNKRNFIFNAKTLSFVFVHS